MIELLPDCDSMLKGVGRRAGEGWAWVVVSCYYLRYRCHRENATLSISVN